MIKVVLAEIAMVLSVAVIVVIATLITMGFFVSSDGNIEQSGLAQIHSLPTGASVTIDGDTLFSRTNLSRTMPEGQHYLKITREKYDTWENQIIMRAGMLLRLYYPRLFLLNREVKEVANFEKELAFYSPSIDRASILLAEAESTNWQLIDIKGDELKTTKLDMKEILPGVEENKFLGKVEEIKWSRSGDHVLAKIASQDDTEWISVNLKDLRASLNLTKTFGMRFSQVEMADGSAGKLFVLENQHLRRINTADQEISRVLLDNVESFANNGADVIFATVAKKDDAENKIKRIGVYRDGEKGSTELATVAGEEKINVAINMYYGDYYLTYMIGDCLTVRYGAWPTYNEAETDLSMLKELFVDRQISFVPEKVEASSGDGYVMMKNAKKVAVVSFENDELYDYEVEADNFKWLDEDMFYTTQGGGLTVWDFDNTNRRKLVLYRQKAELTIENRSGAGEAMRNNADISAVTTISKRPLTNKPVVISANNKWLYYTVRNDEDHSLSLVREMIRE